MKTIHSLRMKERRLDQHTRQRTGLYIDKSKYKADGSLTEYYKWVHQNDKTEEDATGAVSS